MSCPSCGSDDTLYDCPECGTPHCVDHRLPDEHECQPVEQPAPESGSKRLLGLRWYHHAIALFLILPQFQYAGGPIQMLGSFIGIYAVIIAIVQWRSNDDDSAENAAAK